jgi:tetratricopeptide (TPR) repeat protein/two-component sensor histidine kinase
MKTTTLSFLFFYLIAFFSNSTELIAQSKTDSLSLLYYYRIWYPESKKNISLEKAISFFERKFEDSLHKNDVKTKIYDLRTITEGYILQGNYYNSEVYATRALEILDQQPTDSFVRSEKTKLLNELGRNYGKRSDFNTAIDYYNKSLKLAKTSIDSISALNNLGSAYLEWGKYQEALKPFKTALDLSLKNKTTKSHWIILDNIGYIEFKLNLPTGIKKMKKALQMKLKENYNSLNIFSSYRYLAKYYLKKNDTLKAQQYLNLGLKIADSIKSPDFKKEILSLKAQIHSDPNIREYQRLNDSISSSEKQIEHKYSSQKYNFEKAENDRIKAELEVNKANYKTNLWRIAGVVLIIASLFLFFHYKQRNRLEKDRERHRTEQILSKKVHDEVGNDLFYLMTQVQSNPHEFLEKNGIKLLDGLNDIYGKARDISKHYTAVHTGPNYNDELLSLLNSFGSDQVKLIINKTEPNFWETIEANTKETIYRVLQELLTNMKKHSHANFVAITFSKDSKNIFVKYVDNGVGVDLNNLIHKNGLDNVESRMAAQKGSITFESTLNQGFKAFIKLSI